MFGSEIASVNVIPETACLSIFKSSQTNNFKATFYSEAEWAKLSEDVKKSGDTTFAKKYDELQADRVKSQYIGCAPLEEPSIGDLQQLRHKLERYTSAQYPAHLFVKELEIGLSDYPLNKDIFFFDAPGLDDVTEYRSKITKDYMRRSKAVIVCVTASETLRNNDYLTILKAHDSLNDEAEKLLIAGTEIDQLKEDGEWEKQKQEWQKYFEGKNIRHIVGVSSYIHSICKKIGDNKEVGNRDLLDVNRFMGWYDSGPDKGMVVGKIEEIYQKTNVEKILDTLKNGPLKDPLQELKRAIQQDFNKVCSYYLGEIGRKKSILNGELKLMDKSLEEQQAEIAELDKKQEKLKDGDAMMHKFMDTCKEKVREMHENGKAALRKKIRA